MIRSTTNRLWAYIQSSWRVYASGAVEFFEIASVSVVGLAVILSVAGSMVWVVGDALGEHGKRLQSVLKIVDERWKVAAVIALPLFYRPVREFLLRIQEIGNIKAPLPPTNLTPRHKNPTPTKDGD